MPLEHILTVSAAKWDNYRLQVSTTTRNTKALAGPGADVESASAVIAHAVKDDEFVEFAPPGGALGGFSAGTDGGAGEGVGLGAGTGDPATILRGEWRGREDAGFRRGALVDWCDLVETFLEERGRGAQGGFGLRFGVADEGMALLELGARFVCV